MGRKRVSFTPKLSRIPAKPARSLVCTKSPIHRKYLRLAKDKPILTMRQDLATGFILPSEANIQKEKHKGTFKQELIVISSKIYGFEV